MPLAGRSYEMKAPVGRGRSQRDTLKGREAQDQLVSVIIVNYNGLRVIRDCLSSVLFCGYHALEVVVVDNCSRDGSLEVIKSQFGSDSRIKIIENPVNVGFAHANNQGSRLSNGDLLFLLNNDTRVEPGSIGKLVDAIVADDSVAAAQPKLLLMYTHPPKIDSTGDMMDRFGNAFRRGFGEEDHGQFDSNGQIFSARGAAIMVRRSLFLRVGMFDDDFYMYTEDTDLGWRLRLTGKKILYVPSAVVFHVGGGSQKRIGQRDILFHVIKNRFGMIIKNFSYEQLMLAIPAQLMICMGVALYHCLAGNPELAIATVQGLIWNLVHIRRTLSKRYFVQTYVREVSDREIMKYMSQPSLILLAFSVFFKALTGKGTFDSITLLRRGTYDIAGHAAHRFRDHAA